MICLHRRLLGLPNPFPPSHGRSADGTGSSNGQALEAHRKGVTHLSCPPQGPTTFLSVPEDGTRASGGCPLGAAVSVQAVWQAVHACSAASSLWGRAIDAGQHSRYCAETASRFESPALFVRPLGVDGRSVGGYVPHSLHMVLRCCACTVQNRTPPSRSQRRSCASWSVPQCPRHSKTNCRRQQCLQQPATLGQEHLHSPPRRAQPPSHEPVHALDQWSATLHPMQGLWSVCFSSFVVSSGHLWRCFRT